jgi:hypothetical protein
MRTLPLSLLSIATWITACAGGAPPHAPPREALAVAAPSMTPAPRTDLPSGSTYTTARTGDLHDFDFFAGAWTFENRRLKERGVGSADWDEFPARSCTTIYLRSVVNVDEIEFPTKGWSGVTFRHFDLEKRQWSIYWVNSRTGAMFSPVVGGFTGDQGEFYGEDTDNGHPILVRFKWTKIPPDRAHWEQAFSTDGGLTWETNWMNDLTRLDPSMCEEGRPRR